MAVGVAERGHRLHAEPDWPAIHRELKRKHVTLQIVWDGYIAAHPGGYSYSRFCELRQRVRRSCRRRCGRRMRRGATFRRLRGRRRAGRHRSAAPAKSGWRRSSWPCSAHRASRLRTRVGRRPLPDWIDAHVRALTVIGGVPQLICPTIRKPPSSRPAFMTAGQPYVFGDGGALWERHTPSKTEKAPRQIKG